MLVTSETTVEGVARVLVEEGSALLAARTGGLWLVDGDELVLADFRSPVEASRWARMPIGRDAPLPACVREREPIWIDDAEEYERRFPTSSARVGVRIGCACLPLLVRDQVIGAAVFAFEEPRPFSEREKVSLGLLARQCAQTIERIRLMQAERAARFEAELLARRMTALQAAAGRLSAARTTDEIARILIDESIAMIGASAAALWLRSGGEVNMLAQLGASRTAIEATTRMSIDDRGGLGAALRTRMPVWIPSRAAAAASGYPIIDARWHGVESVAFVPLVARDELVGALGLTFAERRSFETGERELIEMFASHAAQALARDREDDGLRIVGEASKAIATTLDPHTVLERLAELAVARVADWCIVDLERDGLLERAVVAHSRPEDAALAEQLRALPPVPGGVPMRAGTREEPILVAPVTDEMIEQSSTSPEQRRLLRELGIRSAVSAPMMIAGRAVGGVTFGSRTRLFDERDVALVVRLAGGAAAAYENARLYAAEAAAASRLGKLYELSAQLSSARTPVEVAQVTARLATSDTDAVSSMIWTRSADGRLRMIGADSPPEWCATWAVLTTDPAVPANRVVATGEPIFLESPADYATHAAAVSDKVRDAGPGNAFAALPLVIEGECAGVLALSFRGAHCFTKEEREFLAAMARSCEQALERAQLFTNEARARSAAEAASRAKDTFVAMAGHALRNRLSPVVTAIEVMRLNGMREGVVEREIIERQVHDLTSLVDDLLGIARGTAQAKGTLPPRIRRSGPLLPRISPTVRSLRVLVVEDNVDAATVLGNLLRILGHEPVIAHDGPDALARAELERPQLALLDIGLPGMDGYELVRRLRERPGLAELPVIALTGYDQAPERDRTCEAGFVEYLVKPIDLQQLHAIVGRFS